MAGGVDRTANRRHAHCKFIVVASTGKSFQNSILVEIGARLKKVRSFSDNADTVEKSAPPFNSSRTRLAGLNTTSKVDWLG
jgi:hypothetical protein